MVKGVCTQIKTLKTTGDVVLSIDVPRELLKDCIALQFESVYLLTEAEYANLQKEKEE